MTTQNDTVQITADELIDNAHEAGLLADLETEVQGQPADEAARVKWTTEDGRDVLARVTDCGETITAGRLIELITEFEELCRQAWA